MTEGLKNLAHKERLNELGLGNLDRAEKRKQIATIYVKLIHRKKENKVFHMPMIHWAVLELVEELIMINLILAIGLD